MRAPNLIRNTLRFLRGRPKMLLTVSASAGAGALALLLVWISARPDDPAPEIKPDTSKIAAAPTLPPEREIPLPAEPKALPSSAAEFDSMDERWDPFRRTADLARPKESLLRAVAKAHKTHPLVWRWPIRFPVSPDDPHSYGSRDLIVDRLRARVQHIVKKLEATVGDEQLKGWRARIEPGWIKFVTETIGAPDDQPLSSHELEYPLYRRALKADCGAGRNAIGELARWIALGAKGPVPGIEETLAVPQG